MNFNFFPHFISNKLYINYIHRIIIKQIYHSSRLSTISIIFINMKNQLINQLIISSFLLRTNYSVTIFHPTIIRFFQASNRYRFIVSRTAIHAIVIKQNPLVSVLSYIPFSNLSSPLYRTMRFIRELFHSNRRGNSSRKFPWHNREFCTLWHAVEVRYPWYQRHSSFQTTRFPRIKAIFGEKRTSFQITLSFVRYFHLRDKCIGLNN